MKEERQITRAGKIQVQEKMFLILLCWPTNGPCTQGTRQTFLDLTNGRCSSPSWERPPQTCHLKMTKRGPGKIAMVKGEDCDMHPHTYIDKLIAFHVKVFARGIYPEAGSNTLLEEKTGGSRAGLAKCP